MSGWNEENFLEKVMPLLEKKVDARVCPDGETLSTVMDGAASPAIRQAVEVHAARCPACADLMRRMGAFSQSAVPGAEHEWRQAERRLDGRMREFLGRVEPRAAWWKLGWILVPITMLAAAAIIWIPKAPSPTVARIDTSRPATPILDKPAPGVANLSATAEPTRTTAEPAPVGVPAAALPGAENSPAAEPAETAAGPAPAAEPETAAAPAPAHSPAAGFTPVVATSAAQAPPEPPAASFPAYVRINAGTRVWILLQSTSPDTSGGFSFQGVVLLPVTQGGTVLLDRQTRVVGTGKVNQGRTTIRIAEFEWQGARYKLRGAPVAVHAPGPGAGPAVEFNAGQVLETWLASVSIYDRVPGGPVPQG